MPDVDPQSLQSKPPEQASTTEPEKAEGKKSDSAGDSNLRKPKNIFVCCDGTGNEFATKDSLDGNSNVVKLYTALKLDVDQVAYYHPGVGTLGDPNKKGIAREWSVIKGMAFGYGFRENVLDAYRYLMQHYASGDRVYVFGFSRGAYTARALAGVLHGYGLLCRGNEGHIPYAWRMYSERVASQKELNARTIETDTTFRDTFSHRDFTIHFVGLWDTVSSIGWVSAPVRLLDLAQNSTIQRGRHAVSIDEKRAFFQDNLWGPPVDVDVPIAPHNKPEAEHILTKQDQQQVWFTGVHSDIGGSYPQLKSGLSNITLEWMIDETRKAGAKFDEGRVRMVLGKPAPGDPAPENEKLSEIYETPNSSMLHKSLHGPWWFMEFLPHRYYDKDDASVKLRIPLGAYRTIPPGSLIHPTVRGFLASDPNYRPKNITLDELEKASKHDGVDAHNKTYLKFQPKIRRDVGLWQNGFIVFALTVLEWSVAAFAVIVSLLEIYRHVHPREIIHWVWSVWHWIWVHGIRHLFPHLGIVGAFLRLTVIMAVIVAVTKTVGAVRSKE